MENGGDPRADGRGSRKTAAGTVSMTEMTAQMASETGLRMAASVSVRRFGEGAVLYEADRGRQRQVNATGWYVVRHLDGRRTVSDIAALVAGGFDDAPAGDVVDDVTRFLAELAADGFVQANRVRARPTATPLDAADVSHAPETVDISVTGRCNLHCAYCFYADEMRSRPDLPTQDWLAFFEQLGSLGVRTVCLSGGEVFVHPDIRTLIDSVTENRMRYSLLTNGTLVTEETVGMLLEGRRRIRLDSIQVSLDGSCAEIHEASRGEGSFGAAVRGLRLLREAGLPVTSRVTINRHNVGDLEAIAALLLDDIGLTRIGTNEVVPLGACHHRSPVTLRPREEWEAMQSLVRLSRRYPGRIQASAGPLAKWHGYHRMEQARAAGRPERGMGYLTACGCFFGKLAVHHDGVITPCNMLPQFELGRIDTTPIRDIWGRHPLLRRMADRRGVRVDQTPGCGDCEWAPYCNGSCPALPVDRYGDLHRTCSQDCYRRFIHEVGRVTELSID